MIDSNNRIDNQLSISYFIIFIFSIGLTITLYKINALLGINFARNYNASVHYYEWAKISMEWDKPGELLGYVLTAFSLFLYYLFACIYKRNNAIFLNKDLIKNPSSLWRIIGYFLFLLLFNLTSIITKSYLYLVLFLCFWSLLFLFLIRLTSFPVFLLRSQKNIEKIKNSSKLPTFINLSFQLLRKLNCFLHPLEKKLSTRWSLIFGLILLCGLIFQTWWTFIPYFTTKPYIHNEYLNIPEKTKLGSQLIDNLNYINEHRLGGLLSYDPRLPQQSHLLVPGKDYISISKSSNLIQLMRSHPEYIYDENYQGLFVDGIFSVENKKEICQIVTALECQRVNQYYDYNQAQSIRKYSDLELKFIKKNMYELGSQFAIGHYFFHHAFFLNPINEYYLGKPWNQIVSQYGFLNAVVVAIISKYIGGLSFANYIKITYIFYPLYYTLVIFAALIIFRNVWYALLVGLICVCSLYLISFEAIYMAPGFNPLRHFFDIFVLIFFYLYLFGKQKKMMFFSLTVFFAVLTLLFDTVFGLFVMGGLALALLVQFFLNPPIQYKNLFILFLGVVVIFLYFLLIKTGKNPASVYYVLGFLVPKTTQFTSLCCLLLVSLIYSFLFFYHWQDSRIRTFLCYLFGFSQLSLVYYIWNPSPNHFYSMVFSWAFLLILIIKEILSTAALNKLKELIVFTLVALLFVLCYLPARHSYYADSKVNKMVFKNHQLYQWNFPTANFITTMNPEPFVDATHLINKYTKENGIHIISRYDNLLPFLAGKYSLMPFDPITLHLITEKEMEISINKILIDKPKYLYVDSSLLKNNRGEVGRIKDPALPIYNISRIRYLMVNENLKKLFCGVESSYQLIEKGQLISVYQLKNT